MFLNKYVSIFLLLSLFLLMIAGCGIFKKRPPELKDTALIRIDSSEYPDFSDDMDYDRLENSILGSISYLNRVPPTKEFKFGQDIFSSLHMINSLEHFLDFIRTKPSKDELMRFIKAYYLIYTTVGSDVPGQVLFTGYFEPVLRGSLYKNSEYQFPIYARPDDLTTIDLSLFSQQFKGQTIVGRYTNQRVVPYYDRKEIEYQGQLEGKVREIAWLKNRIDLFFLQIQGSGKIFLSNGEIINVHYNGTNGHPYRSIGK